MGGPGADSGDGQVTHAPDGFPLQVRADLLQRRSLRAGAQWMNPVELQPLMTL